VLRTRRWHGGQLIKQAIRVVRFPRWQITRAGESARAIVERNHLDSNTGSGSFAYDLPERPTYLEGLSRAGAVTRVEGDSDILTVTTHVSQWEIRLPRTSGSAEWSIRPR
jgi:hypothetical protein